MWIRFLNLPAIARALGFSLIAVAIVVAALHFRTPVPGNAPRSGDVTGAPDTLGEELKRCELIADQAKDDAACEAAWAENRRRFFTYAPASPPAPSVTPKTDGR